MPNLRTNRCRTCDARTPFKFCSPSCEREYFLKNLIRGATLFLLVCIVAVLSLSRGQCS